MNSKFLERIQAYIPNEYEDFIQSLNIPLYKGVRVNTKKLSVEKFLPCFENLKPSPFSKDAYYIDHSIGNHPYHICGGLYMQEPSASSAVTILDPQEDDIVLDLCAAPGSKSTQIARALKNGFLLSNEYESKRAQILLSNMERMGVSNFAITNMDTKVLCKQLPQCFDKILVDAPCSGEGMMKKHDAASEKWSMENIELCASRQKEILTNAHQSLKKDGILVYSTCTYAKEENEEVIAWFLKEFDDMELVEIEADFGRPGLETEGMDASKVCRIFPMDHGEGHFIAKLKKNGGSSKSLPVQNSHKVDGCVQKFLKEQVENPMTYFYVEKGKDHDKVFMMNHPFLKLKKGNVVRQGVYVGNVIKSRFEPAHAFYMNEALQYKRTFDCTLEQMDACMHGLELAEKTERGYVAFCFDGLPFGFGKSDGNRITNKIPKGLRLLPNSHVLEVADGK